MNNDAKERLRTITRNLTGLAFAHAHGEFSTDEDFQQALDALVNHLVRVRERARGIIVEEEIV